MLPLQKRRAIYAVYAFCRLADDCVDIEQDAQALIQLRMQLKAFESGATPDTPIFRALRDVFNHFEMTLQPFYDQLEGQEMDLDFKPFQTMDALERYCYLVASTVGLMILPIIATQHHLKLKKVAIDLGIAMQLTNILRDVGEDLTRQRIYLPLDLLTQHGVALSKRTAPTTSFIQVWEMLAHIAERKYKHFLSQIHFFDKDSRRAVTLSVFFYGAILNAVRKNQYDCLSKRAYVSNAHKLLLILKVIFNTPL